MSALGSFPVDNEKAVTLMQKMVQDQCLDHLIDVEEYRHAYGVITVQCDKDHIMDIQRDFNVFTRNLSPIDEAFRANLEKDIEKNDGPEDYVLMLSRRLCWKTESGRYYHALSVFHYYVHFSPDEDYDFFSSMTPPPSNEKVIGVVSFNPKEINYTVIENVD